MKLQDVRDTIRDAFRLWSNATQLNFTEVMHGGADIMILFASRYHQDGYPFDGKGQRGSSSSSLLLYGHRVHTQ